MLVLPKRENPSATGAAREVSLTEAGMVLPGVRKWLLLAVALSCSIGCGPRSSGSKHSDASGDLGSGSNGCAGAAAAACGSGLVCERYGAPTCVDPNWAQWPMPNAQIEVTAGAANLQSYTDNRDGTVTDDVTKLVWQQLTPSVDYTQPAALAFCAGLDLGGYTDWRLPTLIELVSIVDTGTYDPSIDSTMFPGTPAVGFYWSSTPYADIVNHPGEMWGVYFNNGYATYNVPSMKYSARCVR